MRNPIGTPAPGTPPPGTPPPAATPPADPPKAPVPGTPEHDAAMIAKFDGKSTPSGDPPADTPKVDPPARPEWLPEKFKDPADLAKAYAELEKKLAAPAGDPPKDPPKDPATPPAGVDKATFETANAEFAEKGALSPETYAKLAAQGIDQATVDAYIEGRKAVAEKYDRTAFETAGGEKAYTEMVTWAKANLTPAEAAAYDAAVASGNEASMKLAVQGLRTRFEQANPTLLGGRGVVGGEGYESLAQMTADMRDPRYARDPAFRAAVERKVANSKVI